MSEPTPRVTPPTLPSTNGSLVGRSLIVRGQLSASEDLLINGQFEGTITLEDHCVTVGTEGQLKAEVRARQVIILGSLTGNVTAREKIEIRRTGRVVGDLLAAGIAIEEGAYFKGSIDILRAEGEEASGSLAAPNAVQTSV